MPHTWGYSEQELCDAVFMAVAQASEPLTRLQIAQAIGRKKSPRVIEMIEHLTSAGYFVRSERKVYRGLVALVYSLSSEPPGTAQEACRGT